MTSMGGGRRTTLSTWISAAEESGSECDPDGFEGAFVRVARFCRAMRRGESGRPGSLLLLAPPAMPMISAGGTIAEAMMASSSESSLLSMTMASCT